MPVFDHRQHHNLLFLPDFSCQNDETFPLYGNAVAIANVNNRPGPENDKLKTIATGPGHHAPAPAKPALTRLLTVKLSQRPSQ
jgi:hypothetical protein